MKDFRKEYKPKEIEDKWQKIWEESGIYKLPEFKDLDKTKPKMHILDMFPYPSGEGLHAGHSKIFTASDVLARYKRMQGYNVLHATGWDAFGLPAEQYALKNKVNPKISTQKNIDTFRRQMKSLGLSYDFDREVNTTDPSFYKWTQWAFLKMYEKGLVKEVYEPINWCPSCKTGLANEDLEDGKCERCGSVVEKKPLRQYSIEITKYADRLLSGLENLNWKENIKDLQRNWIGRNYGIKYKLKVKESDLKIETYSTHFEAFYADTFAVIAADHKLLPELLSGIENKDEILEFAKQIVEKKNKLGFKELEDHEGIFTGRYLLDPITSTELPLWISSYALSDYGTGIIKCSAHDTRDFSFAKKYNLPLRVVMHPENVTEEEKSKIDNLEYCFNDFNNAQLFLPEKFNGHNPKSSHEEILNYLVDSGYGEKSTQYKLRDWVFARQRYWGEPFPLVHIHDGVGNKSILTVDESDLPVLLPEVEEYEPTGTGESPLANIDTWVNVRGYINEKGNFKEIKKDEEEEFVKNNIGAEIINAKRETNTMPQWAGSSWYWLRYMDAHNDSRLVGKEEEEYFGQVDVYLGGLEHATRHLIYGRFWNKFLYDIGAISTDEPFDRLEAVGLVLGSDGTKMSKRLGNVVNPDDVSAKWGVDTLRLYLLFMGPYHDSVSWNDANLIGPRRFVERVWAMQYKINNEFIDKDKVIVELNKTIKKVSEDNEKLSYNTAVAQLMILINTIDKENVYEGGLSGVSAETYFTLLKLLSPYIPFVVEEIWTQLGGQGSIHSQSWPTYDETKIRDVNVKIAFQVNGKLRDVIEVSADSSQEYVHEQLLENEMYKKWVLSSDVSASGEVKKVIFVNNKIINFIV
jgi:leucyl-tRNA synthetase